MSQMHQPDNTPERNQSQRPEVPLTLAVRHFVEELALMSDAGLPVVRSLHIAETIEPNPTLKAALGAVVSEVEGGSSLSEALSKQKGVFDSRLIKIVNAGEIGGVLDIALKGATEMFNTMDAIESSRTPSYTTPAMRHWANTLGHLIRLGVPILAAIEESKDGQSEETRDALDKVRGAVREGESMAGAMRENPAVFDPVLTQFVDIGEETGDLDQVLLRFAKRTETLSH